MIIYIVFYVIVILIFKYQKKAYIIIPSLLILFSLIRPENVGSDFTGYCRMIDENHYKIDLPSVIEWYALGDYSSSDADSGVLREFGFSFLICFLKIFTQDSRLIVSIVIFLTYFLYIASIKIVFKKDIESVNLAVFIAFSIFILYASFNTLRQGLSVSLAMFGCVLYLNKKTLIGIIFCLLAATVHFTVVIIFPILILSPYFKIKFKFSIILLLAACVISLLRIDVITSFIKDYMDFGGRDVQHGWNERKENYNAYVNVIQFVFNLYSIFVYTIFHDGYEKKTKAYFNLWYIGLLGYILLIPSPNVGRITEFLYIYMIISMPLALKKYRKDISATGKSLYIAKYQYVMAYCVLWQMFYILRNFYGLQSAF